MACDWRKSNNPGVARKIANVAQPYKSFKDVVAAAKAKPGTVAYGTIGAGSLGHLTMAQLGNQLGVEFNHVPYRGGGPLMNDAIGNQVPLAIGSVFLVSPHIASGKLRAIAVTGPARLPALKDVPTVGEAGFPDLIIQDWFGLLVKRGTPETVIVQLNQAVNRSLQKPRVREAIEKMAAEPAGGTPEEFGKFVSSQLAYWGNVVKNSGITIQQ